MTPWYRETRWAGIVGPILERRFLLALVVLAASIWGFVAITDEVREGDQISLDRRILLMFRNPEDPADPLGPLWFESAVRDVTSLGGVTITTMVTLAAVGFLLLSRRRGAVGHVRAGLDRRRRHAQFRDQGRDRAATAGADAAQHGRLYVQLPQRPRYRSRRHLPDPRSAPRPLSSAVAG